MLAIARHGEDGERENPAEEGQVAEGGENGVAAAAGGTWHGGALRGATEGADGSPVTNGCAAGCTECHGTQDSGAGVAASGGRQVA